MPTSSSLPPMFSDQRLRPHGPYADACIDFLQRMVCTPSLSGHEAALANLIVEEMRKLGFRDVAIDAVGNVVGKIGQKTGPILLIDSHLDNTAIGEQTAWEYDPYGGLIEDGKLYGLGSVDAKGPIASVLYGLGALAQANANLPGQIIVVLTVHEEPTEGWALRAFLENEGIQPDWVLIAKATSLKIVRGHRGRMELRLSTLGRASHAARPEQGENALYAAARLIFGIELLGAGLMSDPVLGQGTITVTQLATSGGGRNVVPDRCDMVIDRRVTLGETASRVLAELDTLIQRENLRTDIQIARYNLSTHTGYKLAGEAHFPAWLLSAEHPLLVRALASVERSLQYKPGTDIWHFSSDGAYTMGMLGIPTIGFGPGDPATVHAPNESIDLITVRRSIALYARLAQDLLVGLTKETR